MRTQVSIVGRPNVGKSTLFNRIIGYQKAITEDTPGVTRDRNYGEFSYGRREFMLVDTGGFLTGDEDSVTSKVVQHVRVAMEESSMIIFLLDGKEGILPQDEEIAALLRAYNKPIFYAVNKVDSKKREADITEFYRLGVDTLYPMSALHGIGVDELLEDIARLAEEEPAEEAKEGVKIAIVGRPNTGKSSLVNRILGADRMIVSEMPGTTRDAIDSTIVHGGKTLFIVDTAGMRKKSRISMKVEEYSVMSAIRSIERADIVNLIIDAEVGVGHQDAAIAHLIVTNGKGIAIVVNKWDLVAGSVREDEFRQTVREKLPHANFAPVLFVSALTGANVGRILETDLKIGGELRRTIATAKLNKAFETFFQRLSLPHARGKQLKIFYVNQAKTSPPTFLLFANYPEEIPEHYKRYLANCVREMWGFDGAPIRLVFKKR